MKQTSRSMATALLAIVFGSLTAGAQVRLQPLFTDNMVLQRETNAPVWGECRPGYYVKITTSWDQKQYTTQADADGHFMQSVATPKAGGPYTVTLTEAKSPRQKGRSVTLHNVMIGEVWLCGGQSNMQLEVEWGRVSNYQDEVRKANNHPDIRLLHVATTAAATPQSTLNAVDGGWQACSSQSVRMFSATAYFFGRELEASLNMPIGLIESCLGSTFAEPWISAGALSQMPYFDEAVAKVAAMPADSMARERQYQSDLEEWNTRVSRQDGNTNYADGRHSIIYNKVFTDSSLWTDIQVPGLFEDQLKDRYGAFDGIVWYRRQINIPESWTGKDLILRLGAVDDDDVTFFNGVEVGSHLGVAFNREYPVPGTLVREGKEEVAVRLHDTGGLGGFYSSEMRLERADGEGEPIALAGTWQFLASLDEKQLPFYPTNLNRDTNVPSALFNGMIRPLIPYALRGAIWYQGESSVGRAYQYRELLPVLINDWRTQWGSSMPFYIVQLANYMSPQTEAGEESTWAELREAQQKVAQSMADCGLATTIDIGEADDIHPKNKQDVGLRLALLARANTYGERVECLGPQYSHYRQEGNSVRLFFTHAEGLKAGSDRLKGFVIAGPDRKFHWAKAHIEGRTVVVSADEVPFPVAVRYGWANNPDCNLYNAADLPATPFRTDEWPGLSVNNY